MEVAIKLTPEHSSSTYDGQLGKMLKPHAYKFKTDDIKDIDKLIKAVVYTIRQEMTKVQQQQQQQTSSKVSPKRSSSSSTLNCCTNIDINNDCIRPKFDIDTPVRLNSEISITT